MLKKVTFNNDDAMNKFFAEAGTIFIIKYIIVNNKHHLIYTKKDEFKNGTHLASTLEQRANNGLEKAYRG